MKSQRPKACQDLSKGHTGSKWKSSIRNRIQAWNSPSTHSFCWVHSSRFYSQDEKKKISKLFISGKFHLWEIPVYQVPIAAKLPTTYLRCKTTTIICYCYYYLSWFGLTVSTSVLSWESHAISGRWQPGPESSWSIPQSDVWRWVLLSAGASAEPVSQSTYRCFSM